MRVAVVCALAMSLTSAATLPARTAARRGPTAARPADDPSLSVVLLMDVSASVSRVPMFLEPRFVQVFNAFARSLKPGDLAGVGIVCRRSRSSALTTDPRELSSMARRLLQVSDTDRLGPSPIWDALDDAVTLMTATSGRPSIVLLSDGKSSGNLHGLQEVTAHARQAGVSISVVVEGESDGFQPGLDPADLIGALVTATGGRLLLDRPANPRNRNPAPLVEEIMDDLRLR